MEKHLTEILEFYRVGRYSRFDAEAALRSYHLSETRIDELLGEIEDWITADDELRWRTETGKI